MPSLPLYLVWLMLTVWLVGCWIWFLITWRRRTRDARFRAGVPLALWIIPVLWGPHLIRNYTLAVWEARLGELRLTTARAGPVVGAINAYIRRNDRPPRVLEDLVPAYLPSLPDAGPASEKGWFYRLGDSSDFSAWTQSAEPWVLGIRVRNNFCPRCGLSFGDYYIYHPGGQYPDSAYGGILERVGAWGYYHE